MPLPPVVAVEIGTTQTVALVGELREDGHVMITGMGERRARAVDVDFAGPPGEPEAKACDGEVGTGEDVDRS